MGGALLDHAHDVHSQFGEDGVLAELLRRLGIERGWCCEFGAYDGVHLSNTRLLLEQGWVPENHFSGVLSAAPEGTLPPAVARTAQKRENRTAGQAGRLATSDRGRGGPPGR